MTNTMPMLTDSEREAAIERCKQAIKSLEPIMGNAEISALLCFRVALAALTADTSKLAELAAKVRKVRDDAADFDGDRRGMLEHQEEQEGLLLEEAVKFTAPPVPALKLPDEMTHSYHDEYAQATCLIWNNCLAEVRRLNGVTE